MFKTRVRALLRPLLAAALLLAPQLHAAETTWQQTLAEAKGEGYDVKVAKFPFTANAKAHGAGDPSGFVKLIADAQTDRILGCHIIGPAAGDLIHEICVAMEFGASAQDIALTCHAHPTYSEAVREAALACGDGAIHA